MESAKRIPLFMYDDERDRDFVVLVATVEQDEQNNYGVHFVLEHSQYKYHFTKKYNDFFGMLLSDLDSVKEMYVNDLSSIYFSKKSKYRELHYDNYNWAHLCNMLKNGMLLEFEQEPVENFVMTFGVIENKLFFSIFIPHELEDATIFLAYPDDLKEYANRVSESIETCLK